MEWNELKRARRDSWRFPKMLGLRQIKLTTGENFTAKRWKRSAQAGIFTAHLGQRFLIKFFSHHSQFDRGKTTDTVTAHPPKMPKVVRSKKKHLRRNYSGPGVTLSPWGKSISQRTKAKLLSAKMARDRACGRESRRKSGKMKEANLVLIFRLY